MIPWKIAWVTIGGVVTLAAGVVPTLFAVSAYVVIPGAVLGGLLVGLVVPKFVHLSDVFHPLPLDSRRFVCQCITVAVFLHVSWVVVLALRPSWLPWWPIVVLVLGAAEWGWCEAHDYILVRRPEKPAQPVTAEGRPLDEIETRMSNALKAAGHSRVTVQDWEPVVDESGVPFGATFRVKLPIARGVSGK